MLLQELRFTASLCGRSQRERKNAKWKNAEESYPKFVFLITIAEAMYPVNCMC